MADVTPSNQDLHKQLSSFVSLGADDEMTQLILEELAMPRRSFANVIAGMATSPSNKSDSGLNSIKEEVQPEEE
ncbi:hypothetical protein P43SY_005555 [Pythium insidiosum]|uniref:Uncharacterized protein n=1 Tax=Pythium insidiosum TaxID=114742 RepID=A0AAD5QAR2_PYTIN|nr:hypothetical protein P43SY_005555 [Pythium insidiosum]